MTYKVRIFRAAGRHACHFLSLSLAHLHILRMLRIPHLDTNIEHEGEEKEEEKEVTDMSSF